MAMRAAVLAGATAAALAAGAARGDDIIPVSGIPYMGVQVTDVSGLEISFRWGGRTHRKPLSEVKSIRLTDYPAITAAEDLLAKGKAAEAADAYDKSARSFGADDWQSRLIRHRRLLAADRAGRVGRAVADWLAIVEEARTSRRALALRPSHLGRRGSEDNAKAIDLLAARLETPPVPDELKAPIGRLLVDLYTLEGKQAKADEMKKLLRAAPAPPPKGGTTEPPANEQPVEVSSAGLGAQLAAVAEDIKGRRYASAMQAIQNNLRNYQERELPQAMLLLGKAQLLSYENGAARSRETLNKAGLNFMWVVVAAHPGSAEAAEAMYLAGRVCRLLGNRTAADNAFRDVVRSCRNSRKEWADKAAAELRGKGGAAER